MQFSKTGASSVARPLGDKTPFANRQRRVIHEPTSGAVKVKPSSQDEKFEFLTPGHALLPSSARKTVRGRHSSGPVFETPVSSGNPWDVIEGDVIAPVAPEAQSNELQTEDYDEIEYMPPTATGAKSVLNYLIPYRRSVQILPTHPTSMFLTTSSREYGYSI